MRIVFRLVFCFCVLNNTLVHAQKINSFQQSIDQWDKKRIAFLTSPEGWVNLTGLFWLHPGKNYFGSDLSNELVYQHPNIPTTAGYFSWENKMIKWVSAAGVSVKMKDSLIQEATIFVDGEKGSVQLSLGSLRWNVIQREEKIGVRLRDLASPALKKLKKIDRFRADSNFKIEAILEKTPDHKLMIMNVLGQVNAQASPGKLHFKMNGINYQLDALDEGEPELFVIFGDLTNNKETYPTGRYMYVPRPDSSGRTVIDFNKSYNPPCAFSVFATCPLPPKQNILPIRITAGEKQFHAESLR